MHYPATLTHVISEFASASSVVCDIDGSHCGLPPVGLTIATVTQLVERDPDRTERLYFNLDAVCPPFVVSPRGRLLTGISILDMATCELVVPAVLQACQYCVRNV